MIDFEASKLIRFCIHEVGNQENSILNLSKEPMTLDTDLSELLKTYFLKPFKGEEFFHIKESGVIRPAIKSIFEDPSSVHDISVELAGQLLSSSLSPGIKTGEFFMVHFTDCQVEDELVDAVGLFKCENKETYLKVFPEQDKFDLKIDQGININRIDKGALILNVEQEEGYLVQVIDRTNQDGAAYWKDAFLRLEERVDEYHHTQNYIHMCRDFAMEEMSTTNRGEQLGLMTEAVNYFQENDHFDHEEFKRQVIREPEIIEAFEDYSKSYELENHLNSIDDFDISSQAVKRNKKFTRSVIKLDKNFHIYVHGSRERIKRGYDEQTGLNFYQVFFEEEK